MNCVFSKNILNNDEIVIEKVDEKTINKYAEYEDEKFIQKLGKFTFGLDKIIPWEDGNFVFSGGLLFDIITNRFSQDLMDIDLFFYGSTETKISTINKLLDNLDKDQYYYLIGINRSVIYIFIQGIPRIIQLIMTDKEEPESIINGFDLSHAMSYTDGDKIYCSKLALEYFNSSTNTEKSKMIKYEYLHKSRIIKYIERNVIQIDTLFDNYNFVLNKRDTNKYLMSKAQIKLYKLTHNLTKYKNGEPIDFTKYNKYEMNFNHYFGCTINYDKLDNHNFVEGIDMFGAFAEYMGTKKENIVEVNGGSLPLNDDESNKSVDLKSRCLFLSFSCMKKIMYYDDNEHSVYIPCNFINYNLTENESKKQVINLKFEIDNEVVIKYLVTKLDKLCIKNALNELKKEFKYKTYNNLIVEEIQNIHLPFDESEAITGKLTINSKLSNQKIRDFNDVNEFEILNSIEFKEKINCLFDIKFNVLKNTYGIHSVDVELCPIYIFKKK